MKHVPELIGCFSDLMKHVLISVSCLSLCMRAKLLDTDSSENGDSKADYEEYRPSSNECTHNGTLPTYSSLDRMCPLLSSPLLPSPLLSAPLLHSSPLSTPLFS